MEGASSPAAPSPARGRAARCGGRAIEAPDTALFEGRFTCNSPPCGDALLCPTSFAGHGALKTTGGKAEVPSLHKEGWLRPLRKCRGASLAGADGGVGSSHRLSEVERTTPAAPSKEWDHLLDGTATPPLPRRGLRLSRRLSQTPVSSGRLVGNAQASLQGGVAERFRKYREASAYREAGVVFR